MKLLDIILGKTLIPFFHVKTLLSSGPRPTIFYDGRMIYHRTDPGGCRYKCNFTRKLDNLTKGDVAVFSMWFNPKQARQLIEKGVLIAFQSIESPVHAQRLSAELEDLVRRDSAS